MIILFTDFGHRGPYVGQMKAVLAQQAPNIPVIDLMHDAPVFDAKASAYLLAAYVDEFPEGTVILGVVDPGVGNAQRKPVMVQVDGRWFVGPDNGLFEVVAKRGANAQSQAQWWEITWRPEKLSNSFHGRDLFAPVAARLACGEAPPGEQIESRKTFAGPDDFPAIVYIDHFGNAITGLRAKTIAKTTPLKISGQSLVFARTFSEVRKGQAFWYENANGLVEIAVNRGHAADLLELHLGDQISF
jgi:hypothetical protein